MWQLVLRMPDASTKNIQRAWGSHSLRCVASCFLQALNALDSMASNKQYAEYQEQLSQASHFIKDSRHCLRDGTRLLAILVNTLYPEVHHLDAIR